MPEETTIANPSITIDDVPYQIEDLNVDYLEEDENLYVTGLDIDFLQQNFLADILKQINEELALQMRNEFDKQQERMSIGEILPSHNEVPAVILSPS